MSRRHPGSRQPGVKDGVPDPRGEAPERTVGIGETFAKVMAATERPAYVTDFLAKARRSRYLGNDRAAQA